MSRMLFVIVRWLTRESDAAAWWELGLPRWTRWMWHALEWLDDLPWRLRNLRLFFSAAWRFNSCDWAPSFRLLRVALLENAACFEDGHAVGCEARARECRIAAELIRRMIDDADDENWLCDISRSVYVMRHRRRLPLGSIRSREYPEMLGRLIAKRMLWWWD